MRSNKKLSQMFLGKALDQEKIFHKRFDDSALDQKDSQLSTK